MKRRISITNVELSFGQSVPNVYGEESKRALLSKCGCSITSSSIKQFTHFKAQEFKMFRNGKGTCSYSTTKGKKLLCITYSAIGNRNTEERYHDFEQVINTFEIL